MKKFGPLGGRASLAQMKRLIEKTSVGSLKSKKCHNGSIMVSPRIFATAVHDYFNCKTDPCLNGPDRRLILPFLLIWRCDCELMQSFFVCSLCHHRSFLQNVNSVKAQLVEKHCSDKVIAILKATSLTTWLSESLR